MSNANIVPIRMHTQELREHLIQKLRGSDFQITDMPKLNKITGGFERRKMVVFGARPSHCKSLVALQLAYQFSETKKALFLSLEMTRVEALFRLMCKIQQISNTSFSVQRGCTEEQVLYAVKKFEENLNKSKRKLIVLEQMGKNWEEIDTLMEKLKDDRPDIIFLDYIQCITKSGKGKDAIDDYIRKFRALAIERDFCLVICSQINRQTFTENKAPTMEGLKETGFLEEHADQVVLFNYPHKVDENIAADKFQIIVAKNKNGPTGYINCKIKPDIYTVYEEEESDLEQQKERLEARR